MKYQLKEKAWRMTFLVFATCALFSCSDDENDPSRDDNEPPLSEATVPTPNPYLASEHYSLTHFNSAQTDAFPYAVKGGTFQINPDDCASTWSGPVNLMTLSSTDPDYMWGMCSDRVSYIHIADGTFERVAEIGLPNGIQMNTEENLRKLVDTQYTSTDQLYADAVEILGKYPQMSMSNGNYVICDNENYAYTNARTVICRYKLKEAGNPKAGIVLDKQVDMAPYMDNPQTLVGMVMTYDGYLVVASGNGIAIIDRTMSMPPVVKLIPDDQVITNSAAVDEHNGIYIASNSRTPGGKGIMHKFVWKNGKLSEDEADGAWTASYDGGPEAPAIKMGYGTGSTPTLMGFGDDEDKLVVITDGAKRMKLVAFWRDDIPEDAVPVDAENPRIADQKEISCGLSASTEWIQSEQSVAISGYGAFVVNNVIPNTVPDKIVAVLSIGPLVTPPFGVERLQWDTEKNQWYSVWTRSDVSSISMIPAISTASNMVFVNGYTEADGWEVTGLDWGTGATSHRVIFGQTSRGNGAYAIIQYMENGDLLFNSVGGPFRVKL
ncbi:hypothetical protein KSZ12_16780 [Parabacteroides distasonis]|jgi:hypothetical protein|uniref:hypothetical protein n=1 Tax=Parabacteroides distasonis TaxID=823 RepID=UPI001C3825E1|nr:hypothetical protein [Parabacteroides distasonis]MBV4227473.1 hypothetical protein [Parabacteroides distasonis]